MSITVYSSGLTCIRCRLSIDVLDKAGVAFDVVDIRTDRRAHEYVTQELGYSQAPVVVVTDAPAGHHPHQDSAPTKREHWSGFRPDRLRALAGASTTQTTTTDQVTNREQVSAS